MRALLLFPVSLIQAGGVTAFVGTVVAIVYMALGAALLRVLFQVVNSIAVTPIEDVAMLVNKRTIAAHKEWQGRYMVNVPEIKVLDLTVRGENVKFIAAEWIYERAVENAPLAVRFRRGRVNKKIIVDRVTPL